ncbi:MAG: MgtC/SapB family protein [Actinomycetota bacterium]|nr:MgtC/SapB family protein [Actinomycetota bacterium]
MEELTTSYPEITIRLLITVVLCGVIGLEREMRDHAAGFRTHILLGLGAALFTLVSAYGFEPFTAVATQGGARSGVVVDPTRIAAQIVTGIGFLGAGAIIRQGIDVRGLTTAASLWATAAIGMAVGAGYYFGAVATTVVVIVALYLLRKLQSIIVPRFRTDFGVLQVTFGDAGGKVSEVISILDQHDISVRNLSAEVESGQTSYSIQIRIPPSRDVQDVLGEIATVPNVQRAGIGGLHEVE